MSNFLLRLRMALMNTVWG